MERGGKPPFQEKADYSTSSSIPSSSSSSVAVSKSQEILRVTAAPSRLHCT